MYPTTGHSPFAHGLPVHSYAVISNTPLEISDQDDEEPVAYEALRLAAILAASVFLTLHEAPEFQIPSLQSVC